MGGMNAGGCLGDRVGKYLGEKRGREDDDVR